MNINVDLSEDRLCIENGTEDDLSVWIDNMTEPLIVENHGSIRMEGIHSIQRIEGRRNWGGGGPDWIWEGSDGPNELPSMQDLTIYAVADNENNVIEGINTAIAGWRGTMEEAVSAIGVAIESTSEAVANIRLFGSVESIIDPESEDTDGNTEDEDVELSHTEDMKATLLGFVGRHVGCPKCGEYTMEPPVYITCSKCNAVMAPVWESSNGKTHFIHDMDIDHIRNAINLLETTAKTRRENLCRYAIDRGDDHTYELYGKMNWRDFLSEIYEDLVEVLGWREKDEDVRVPGDDGTS